MGVKKNALEAEWSLFQKKEENFLVSREVKKDSYLNQKLADKVPAKLQGQLDKAFAKAFGMVFEKGTGVIEKTYKKEELQKTFKINEYANEVRQTRKSLKTFGRRAENSGRINMLVSGVAGVGMGVVGVGIPDIPVFTGMILKSIYEIALNYGYEYDTEGERRFILLLIQGAVSYGQEMLAVNELVDLYIQTAEIPDCYDEKEQIEKTAAGLSKELLYMKFLQGIPLLGAGGGAYDVVYLKRITEYANLKYKKRFLLKKKKEIIMV